MEQQTPDPGPQGMVVQQPQPMQQEPLVQPGQSTQEEDTPQTMQPFQQQPQPATSDNTLHLESPPQSPGVPVPPGNGGWGTRHSYAVEGAASSWELQQAGGMPDSGGQSNAVLDDRAWGSQGSISPPASPSSALKKERDSLSPKPSRPHAHFDTSDEDLFAIGNGNQQTNIAIDDSPVRGTSADSFVGHQHSQISAFSHDGYGLEYQGQAKHRWWHFRRSAGKPVARASTQSGFSRFSGKISARNVSAADKVKGLLGSVFCFTVVWFLMSSTLLVLFGVQYDGLVVDEDRRRYVASTVERTATEAVNVLSAGLAARDAVDHAIRNKLYFEPMDYATLRATMEPVFAGFPSLRSVDLAFTDRNDSITIRRLVADEESVASFMSIDRAKINVQLQAALAMQSSAADCNKLGERGCLSSFPANTQRWHRLASGLWGGEETDGFKDGGDEVFRWDDRPVFVPADPSRGGRSHQIKWAAAYSLLFRTAFPGSSGNLSVLGRSVIELTDLRADESLQDTTLGPKGAMYIVDRAGNLLAANAPGEQVIVQRENGVFRFRHIDELEAPWAPELQNFNGKKTAYTSGGFHVAASPLRGYGLGNFSAVVAAERDSFIDSRLAPMLDSSKVVAVLPYPVFILVFFGFKAYREVIRRKNMRRVHVLHRGIATLVAAAAPEEEAISHAAAMSKLRRRIISNKLTVARDAKLSMEAYIEHSAEAIEGKQDLEELMRSREDS